jgi:hypothetical protein
MKTVPLFLICLLLTLPVCGQRNARKVGSFNQANRVANAFLQKQWWLGFKAGPNLSKVVVEKTYHVITPTNYDVTEISKRYKNFRSLGSQVAFEVTFTYRRVSVSFQPTYRTNSFTYSNEYKWTDPETPDNHLELNFEQQQKIAYLDWPLIGKYEFQAGKIRPYAQFGIYSSLRVDATKSVAVTGIDYASGGLNHFENEPIIIGASDLFARYHWGLLAGAGIDYPIGNVRINVDIAGRIGMSNIASTQNRYGSDRLSGVGDNLDDMRLQNIALSVGCLFPLRFLGSGFKSMVD